ncbi:thermonuclease family protein [Paludisphaera mucosa]|uniref:TNase-like domain-containing protein n=1 Tax=Paludisphaera mucosa TaxID=3030827 RepID=A0ABT6F5J6_9BACT|nr:hypothetical protein [Paludisphaera mucosa]MDG3002850.1 hypothetical protein [Paludisphaera mucosa]
MYWMLAAALLGFAEREDVTVKLVLDGNTIIVDAAVEKGLLVDLVGLGMPDTIDARKPRFLVGAEDKIHLAKHLPPGTAAKMERVGETSTGRPLVVLYRADGLCWNEWAVSAGVGFFTTTDLVDYTAQERKARAARHGVWALGPVVPVAAAPDRPAAPAPAAAAAEGDDPPSYASSSPGATTPRMYTKDFVPPARVRKRRYAPQPYIGVFAGSEAFFANPNAYGFAPPSAFGFGGPRPVNIGGGFGGYGVNPNQHQTSSYTRRDGTRVSGYRATNPNGTTADNLGGR